LKVFKAVRPKNVIPKIVDLATAVYDRGRRGNPLPGCDCVQCFGYCLVVREAAEREMFARAERMAEDEAA